MKYEITPNGNLLFTSEPDDAEMLAELKERHEGVDVAFLDDLLEKAGWSTNGHLQSILPEDVGALTDSPIVTDDMSFVRDGEHVVNGRVWWFPDYQVKNFADVLIEKGSVLFRLAPDIEAQPLADSAPVDSYRASESE